MDAYVIDSFEFCRLGERREGTLRLAELPRLAKEAAGDAGDFHWSVRGSTDQYGHARLKLDVSGDIVLVCQRCLAPYTHAIASSSTLVLAKDDSDIEAIEEILDDDELDVITGAKDFRLLDIIEDEALLALPLAPKHERCPETAATEALKSSAKPSPFAVLKNLK